MVSSKTPCVDGYVTISADRRSLVLLGLALQIVDVDVPFARARDDHDAHAGHHRAGGIGAVRRGRNQHHVARGVAAIAMVGADHHQAGELALRTGVRLQRDRGEAGDRRTASTRAR